RVTGFSLCRFMATGAETAPVALRFSGAAQGIPWARDVIAQPGWGFPRDGAAFVAQFPQVCAAEPGRPGKPVALAVAGQAPRPAHAPAGLELFAAGGVALRHARYRFL